ncbi:unnamed protein product [Gemmataceae bacterium]|nr:unnamed protein product [Gemmataceae bacterium]VTT98733.1 unnamed protein product [Gemmataceae bacterium]
MTIHTRRLCGVLLLAAATGGPVAAQPGATLYPPPPGGTGDPAPTGGASAVQRVAAPVRLASEQSPDPLGTLTGQSAQPPAPPNLPPGAYASPYYTDGPGALGPMGRNGRIGYDLYAYTGPTFAFGEGRFARQLQTGWMTGGGGRSLFFNPAHDAAWALDLGLSYQFNRGSVGHYTELELRRAPTVFGNTTIPRSDIVAPLAIRGLSRTNFNFGVGRDWWYWGPGLTGLENGWNYRFGTTAGGRWGTAHVDLVPQDEAALGSYARRQAVTHGVFIESHATVEVPMGAWILFGGLRTEWGYDWTNLVPPINGNLHNFNLLMTAGIRF